MAEIAARRQEAKTRLTELKHMHGIALLDGKDFDLAEMTNVERELSGLEAAEGEAARRQRLDAAKAEEARIAGLREKLAKRNDERLEAAAVAEKAARDLGESFKLWIAANGDCARLVRALNQKGGAGLLDRNETEARLSRFLTNVLKPLTGLGRKLGMITFPDAWDRFDGNWADVERTITQPEILQALEGTDK